jgi:hypothetical protein
VCQPQGTGEAKRVPPLCHADIHCLPSLTRMLICCHNTNM